MICIGSIFWVHEINANINCLGWRLFVFIFNYFFKFKFKFTFGNFEFDFLFFEKDFKLVKSNLLINRTFNLNWHLLIERYHLSGYTHFFSLSCSSMRLQRSCLHHCFGLKSFLGFYLRFFFFLHFSLVSFSLSKVTWNLLKRHSLRLGYPRMRECFEQSWSQFWSSR
jgi:hypothetical protein